MTWELHSRFKGNCRPAAKSESMKRPAALGFLPGAAGLFANQGLGPKIARSQKRAMRLARLRQVLKGVDVERALAKGTDRLDERDGAGHGGGHVDAAAHGL